MPTTKMITLYKFGELPKDIQEKVINKRREYYPDDETWWEFMHEDFSERLKEIGIECKDFYWDFDRGRYFKMDDADIKDETLFLTSAGFQKQLILVKLEGIDLCWDIGITNNRESTNEINIDFDYDDDGEVDKIKEIFGEDIEQKLTDYLQEILYGFLKELEKEYYYMGSDEGISEDLINKEEEFLENGEMA